MGSNENNEMKMYPGVDWSAIYPNYPMIKKKSNLHWMLILLEFDQFKLKVIGKKKLDPPPHW